MDDQLDLLRQHEALLAIRLYSLLDHLIQSIVPPEVDVRAGGFPEEIFITLSEQEKENLSCTIWYAFCLLWLWWRLWWSLRL